MRHYVYRFGSALVVAVALGTSLFAAESPLPSSGATSPPVETIAPVEPDEMKSDPEAVKWLSLLEERHADHRRVRAEFTQIREDPVFLEDIVSSGVFYYERPDRFRCDYLQPQANQSFHLVTGNEVESYYPSIRQVERYRMEREGQLISDVNQMLLAFGIDTDAILEDFVVKDLPTTSPDRVRLVFYPKRPPEQRPFQRFVLELTKRALQPVEFEIFGDADDHTRVTINNIWWNQNFDRDTFQLKYPSNVEIIEQL